MTVDVACSNRDQLRIPGQLRSFMNDWVEPDDVYYSVVRMRHLSATAGFKYCTLDGMVAVWPRHLVRPDHE